MNISEIVKQAEARLRVEGHWPPNGPGYDLNNPQLRAELLSMDDVLFRLHPLPSEIKSFLDGINRPMTPSEEDVICDYLDSVYTLSPDFGTSAGDDGTSIWVFENESSLEKKRRDPAWLARQRSPLNPALLSSYDLHQLKDMVERLDPEDPQ